MISIKFIGNTNVRPDPSTRNAAVGRILKDTILRVPAAFKPAVGDITQWIDVSFEGPVGYVRGDTVTLEAEHPPVEPPVDPTDPETNPNPPEPSGETVAIEYFWAVVDGLKAENEKQRRYIETLEDDTALLREIRLLLSRAAFDD